MSTDDILRIVDAIYNGMIISIALNIVVLFMLLGTIIVIAW